MEFSVEEFVQRYAEAEPKNSKTMPKLRELWTARINSNYDANEPQNTLAHQ
jgi:hypothetical protein